MATGIETHSFILNAQLDPGKPGRGHARVRPADRALRDWLGSASIWRYPLSQNEGNSGSTAS